MHNVYLNSFDCCYLSVSSVFHMSLKVHHFDRYHEAFDIEHWKIVQAGIKKDNFRLELSLVSV